MVLWTEGISHLELLKHLFHFSFLSSRRDLPSYASLLWVCFYYKIDSVIYAQFGNKKKGALTLKLTNKDVSFK